jgi:hypothetical protein
VSALLALLEWIFASGWRFAGCLLFLWMLLAGLTDIARAFRRATP